MRKVAPAGGREGRSAAQGNTNEEANQRGMNNKERSRNGAGRHVALDRQGLISEDTI